MTRIISKFREQLHQINLEVLASPIPDISKEMSKTTQRLRTEFGDISRGVANQQGIAIAVAQYVNSGQLNSYRDTKYVCFGISLPYGVPQTFLIEHESLFPKLLKFVDQVSADPRKFRRCYQGLLKGYLRYPGQQTESTVGQKNWLILREFLAKHCSYLKNLKPSTEWAQALYDHRNLLADNPCKPYGKALLNGDMSVIEELKNRLGVDDDTWVMNELVLAKVQAATLLKDKEFSEQVFHLVELLENHPLLLTRGLAILVRRYEQCQDRPEHHTLRDVSIREWKSPWLDTNKPFWYAQVGESATEMVSVWLKKRTIRDFFELLQADGQADRQRMEFWLQYAEQIDDIWLALGKYSVSNIKPDYRRIRQNMVGRWMELVGGGNLNQDNAFLMRIGGFVFIEFGKNGSACHVFAADNLPFKFGQKTVQGTQDGLKNTDHSGHRAKLTHRDGWQWEFSNFLRSYANTAPGQSKPKNQSVNNTHSVKPSTTRQINKQPQTSSSNTAVDMQQLRKFCNVFGFQIDDHRSIGGALWVRAPERHPVATQKLMGFGFTYTEGKGWWLK
jgi:hypothetical protein